MGSGEVNVKLNSSGQLRVSQTNPIVEVANNTNRTKGGLESEEYEYYSEEGA